MPGRTSFFVFSLFSSTFVPEPETSSVKMGCFPDKSVVKGHLSVKTRIFPDKLLQMKELSGIRLADVTDGGSDWMKREVRKSPV